MKKGERFLNKALELVESESIRSWATSSNNHPIWVKIAEQTLKNKGPNANEQGFAAYIIATAMGL